MPASSEARRLAAQVGGFATSSRHDTKAFAAKARAAAWAKYEREVDPDGVLDPAERQRRALARRREHMARIAYASAKARRLRREADALTAEASALAERAELAGTEGGQT